MSQACYLTEYYCPNNTKIEYFPYTEEGNRYPSRERFVRFDDLTTDIGNQRVYWYDYKGEKARLLETAGKVAWGRKNINSVNNMWIFGSGFITVSVKALKENTDRSETNCRFMTS